jgi:hypothetical protein
MTCKQKKKYKLQSLNEEYCHGVKKKKKLIEIKQPNYVPFSAIRDEHNLEALDFKLLTGKEEKKDKSLFFLPKKLSRM